MAARVPLLLPAIALVLAGCTSDGHDHGSAGEPALLLGFTNALEEPTTVSWSIASPNGTVVWQANATVAPTKTAEKLFNYTASGDHEIRVEWTTGNGTGTGTGNGTATYEPTDCKVLTHIILTVAPEGLAETKRECHDD